jgi:Ergosterol biosynthesis ERG4/ERG24 family
MSAISTATDLSKLRHRANNGSSETTVTNEGRKTDKLLDSHTRWVLGFPVLPFQGGLTTKLLVRWEFGGPWGVTAMMIGFPMLMYYLWICLWFHDGQLVVPTSIGAIKPFIHEMWAHIRDVGLSIGHPNIDSIFFYVGCQPQSLCMESVFRPHFLRAIPCLGYAWLYARGLACAISWL